MSNDIIKISICISVSSIAFHIRRIDILLIYAFESKDSSYTLTHTYAHKPKQNAMFVKLNNKHKMIFNETNHMHQLHLPKALMISIVDNIDHIFYSVRLCILSIFFLFLSLSFTSLLCHLRIFL